MGALLIRSAEGRVTMDGARREISGGGLLARYRALARRLAEG